MCRRFFVVKGLLPSSINLNQRSISDKPETISLVVIRTTDIFLMTRKLTLPPSPPEVSTFSIWPS